MLSWGPVYSRSSVAGACTTEHLCASVCGSTLGQRSGTVEVTVLVRDFLEEVGPESNLKTQKGEGEYCKQVAAWANALERG